MLPSVLEGEYDGINNRKGPWHLCQLGKQAASRLKILPAASVTSFKKKSVY